MKRGRRREFFFEIQIRATVAAVWRAIVEPKLIPKWSHMERVKLNKLAVGGTYRFFCENHPVYEGEILDVRKERILVYRWTSSEIGSTVVAYVLIPDGRHTKLVFLHYGFGLGRKWDTWYERALQGCVELHLKLKRYLEGTLK